MHVDPPLNPDIHPSWQFLALESMSRYAIVSSYIAGTLDPCASLPDAKGYTCLYMDEMWGAVTKQQYVSMRMNENSIYPIWSADQSLNRFSLKGFCSPVSCLQGIHLWFVAPRTSGSFTDLFRWWCRFLSPHPGVIEHTSQIIWVYLYIYIYINSVRTVYLPVVRMRVSSS